MSRDITLRQLRYLVTLSEARSFRRAAAMCGISQPSLSQQIKALEEVVGAVLVDRGGQALSFTPLGRELTQRAIEILDLTEAMKARAQAGALHGVIKLGVKPTLGPYLLPPVVRRLHTMYPELRLAIREAPAIELEAELVSGVHDLILGELPIRSPDVVGEAIFREPFYLAVAADHPLATRKQFKPEDLSGLEVLTLGPRYHLHDQVQRLCEQYGATMRRDYEGTSLDALRQMVGMGLGVTFLPALYVASEVRGGEGDVSVLKPSRATLFRTVSLIRRKTAPLEPFVDALLDVIVEVARQDLADLNLIRR